LQKLVKGSFINIVEVNIDNFEQTVIEQSYKCLVLLDISAKWCGPCKVIEPILDKIADSFKDEIVLCKLEAEDENMKIAGRYNARGFPTVIAIADGVELERFHGAKQFSFIENFVNRNLK
jgi:putative thioredoxin